MKLIKLFVVALGTVLMLLPQVSFAADVEAGAKLYKRVCVYCHRLDYDDKFGPGLAGITERQSNEWLDKFLLDPAAMIKSDEYAQSLKESNDYGMTMPALPEMKDAKNRADVIAYMATLVEE